MRIEVVVTDLDGTLWELEDAVHDRTRTAILHLLTGALRCWSASGDLQAIVETERVLAFGVLGIDERSARLLEQDLAAVATPHLDRDRGYGGYAVTVAPRTQSKWDGVAAFCALHGLDPGAVMAIGDGPNDAELLGNAAIAVVPDDAHPAARRHADHAVGCAGDGGWADILDLLDVTLPG